MQAMEADRCLQRMSHLILREASKMSWMSLLNESSSLIDCRRTVENCLRLDDSHVLAAEDTTHPK